MQIKVVIFCFVHIQWYHNEWASNILIVVEHSNLKPIHYDTTIKAKQQISCFIM